MSRIEGYNQAGSFVNALANNRQAKETKAPDKSKEAAKSSSSTQLKAPELSEKAQAVLDRLKEKYKNMDFMVADFTTDEEAQDILSRGTKEFSAVLTPEELEKMAEDEEYEKANMDKIDQAMEAAKSIAEKLEEEGEEGVTARVGVSFNADGTMSFFAELEKAGERQAAAIKEAREARAEARKEEAKEAKEKIEEKRAEEKKTDVYAKEDPGLKRTSVKASSAEELWDKIKAIDWTKIPTVAATSEGAKLDFSV